MSEDPNKRDRDYVYPWHRSFLERGWSKEAEDAFARSEDLAHEEPRRLQELDRESDEEREDVKVAVADALGQWMIEVNERMDGPFIPPTAIDWLRREAADVAASIMGNNLARFLLEASPVRPGELERLRKERDEHREALYRTELLAERKAESARIYKAERDALEAEIERLREKLRKEPWKYIEKLEAEQDDYREALDELLHLHREQWGMCLVCCYESDIPYADMLQESHPCPTYRIARAALDGDGEETR